jgi:site-specific recombinase XerD
MKIEDALAMFTLQLEADGRSPHTRDQYARHVRSLARWHDGPIETITHEVLARFLVAPEARLRPDGKPRKATVVNALRSSLRGFFAYCSGCGILQRDPSRLIRRARCGPPPPRTLSPEDQQRLLTVLRVVDGGRDYALFHLLLGAGLRIGSALALNAGDCDLERGEVHVRRAKGDRRAIALLPRGVRDHLRQYLAGRTEGPVFPRMTARHANRRLKYWLAKAGIEAMASPHTLRHCFGQAVYNRTHDILLLQTALGHASVVSTAIYARADRERLRAVLGA